MLYRKNNNYFAFSLLFSLILLSTMAYGQQANTDTIALTVEDAKEMAIEQNPTIRASKLGTTSAEHQLNESRGNLLPHFNISGSFDKNIIRPTMYLPFMEEMGQDPYVEVGTEYNVRAALSGSMPVYSPAAYANINADRKEVELAEEEYRGSKIDLAFDVQQAYFNALLTKESKNVIKNRYNNALENLNYTRKMHSQGVVSEYDKIRAEVETENLEPEVKEMENAYEMAVDRVKTMIGMNKDQPVKLEGDLLNATESYIAQFQIVEPERQLANNPEIRQMSLNKDVMKEQSKAIMATALPSVNAVGNYNYTADPDDLKISDYHWVESFSAGLQISIPIFQGFTVKNRAKQMDVAVKQLGLQKDHVEDNLRMQLNNILKRFEVAVENADKAEKNVELAERGHGIAKTRYKSGQGNLLEVNDSEVALTQARFNLIQAKYDILMAIIEYEKFVGEEF